MGVADVDLMSGRRRLIGAVGSWMFCSMGMTLFNKLALTAFQLPLILVLVQVTSSAIILTVFGWQHLHSGSVHDVLRWLMVTPFFTGTLVSSVMALKYAPMSLFIVFRGLAPFFGMIAERFFPNPIRINSMTLVSMLVMFGGVGIYASQMDIAPGLQGIGWVMMNNFCIVGDRVLERLLLVRIQKPVELSTTSAALLNNVLAMIPLAVIVACTKEPELFHGAAAQLGVLDITWIALSCVAAAGLTYLGVWTVKLVSATSMMVLQMVGRIVLILIEAFVLRSKTLTRVQFIGACLAIVGGVAFGKVRERLQGEQDGCATQVPETQPLVKRKAVETPAGP